MNQSDALDKVTNLTFWTGPADVAPLEGGITNHNFLASCNGEKFVVRVGEDILEHGVMRWNELAITQAAASAGISPGVRHVEPGILVLDYIESTALEETDLHNAETLKAAARLVRKAHDTMPALHRGPILSFWVFQILRDYAARLRDEGSDHVPKLDGLLQQSDALERAVGPVTMVLGHNDLLPANLLRGADRLWLIDWEYGGFNSPLFDLGGLATNCALEREAEHLLLETYFGAPLSDTLLSSFDAMKCASLLRETMWSMVSEITSEQDFDYADYTIKNLDRYQAAYADFIEKRA